MENCKYKIEGYINIQTWLSKEAKMVGHMVEKIDEIWAKYMENSC